MDTFPDLGALSDQELKDLIQQLTEEEQEVSYRRRILHGKIDILRAELVNRLRKKHEEGESVISGADVQQLTDILSGKGMPATETRRRLRTKRAAADALPRVRLRQRRGRQLLPEVRSVPRRAPRSKEGDTTEAYQVDETGELKPVDLEEVDRRGRHARDPLGRRALGRGLRVAGERMTIGRSPEAEVFLDDVTVSRNHALLVRRRDGLYIDDLGSLNGTYVNRRRIESHKLPERRRAAGRQVQADLPRHDERRATGASTRRADPAAPASRRRSRSAPSASSSSASSRTSRSRRSATSRTRSCSRRGARRAATGSTRPATWPACARSCASSATSSCRCG